ncbi:TPA: SGNH/GDSL hydrolase family protein, partial [Klebsiella pneumoniae]|nr:SGNH/GDSL hydrolase family protein [Klebsiella pneumoniae]
MASLDDKSLFEDIFRLENDTPAEAIGPEGDISYANIQAQQLANRTRWLRTQLVSISDFREYTFFKTAEDPDGTIAGCANTPNGKLFRVSQGEDDELAFKYYLNKDGVPIPDTTLIGVGSVTSTIRYFLSLSSAQSSTDEGLILSGAKCWIINSSDITLADEYINEDGTLQPTGRKMPSQYVVEQIRQQINYDAVQILKTSYDEDGNVYLLLDEFGELFIASL